MSNVIVENFGYYGTGDYSDNNPIPLAQNLLSGAWAQIPILATVSGVSTLPWDITDSDLYAYNTINTAPYRRVIPAGPTAWISVSMYYAVSSLPNANNVAMIAAFCDNANVIKAQLYCQSTGVLQLYNNNGLLLASSSGPVIVAETATHLEFLLDVTGTHFKLYTGDDDLIIDQTGLTLTGTGDTAQLRFMQCGNNTSFTQYFTNLIVRDNSGGKNDTIPIGDRRVAYEPVAADDIAHQGWTGEPRHRFGTGILDNRANNNSIVTAAATSSTDLGVADFTIEGSFRFYALPTGGNKAVFFGKWDEANNRRSYEWYIGGSTLENGNTVFQISTDGLAGTVVERISWPWVPDLNVWYHLAISRTSGELLFFIDGVQQGLPVADASAYFAGLALTGLGAQSNGGSSVLANSAFTGFIDEFRLTVGYARYTADFTPPVAAFPRGAIADPQWSFVQWLSGFDSGIFDESATGRALTARNNSIAITPDDGTYNFQCLNQLVPRDDTFIQASLLAAMSVLTQIALPVANKTVTVGTVGTGPAVTGVYKWVAGTPANPYEVKIGVDVNSSLDNLVNAIISGPGAGTVYGTGTLVNNDVSAFRLPIEQMEVQALTPGVAGNAIATSTNDANGSWTGATLSGGADIPAYSQFSFARPPNNTTIIDSVTIVSRSFKTDSGTCKEQISFVGAGGAVLNGADVSISTVPTYQFDTFEEDPDTSGDITPTTFVSGKVRVDRTG